MLLPNSTSLIHTSHYASTDESYVLNIHVDLQNLVEICNVPDSFMNCIVGYFSQQVGNERKVSLPMVEIQW